MVKCLIVDDEPLALDILSNYISATPGFELCATFTRPLDAFAFLQSNQVDLLFIDIRMPELSGLELVRSLKHPPQVVLTTAFREYGADGFELHALDYLVKPISRERFLRTIDKFSSTVPHQNPFTIPEDDPHVFIKVDKAMVRLRLNDVFFIESLKNYVRIKTVSKDLVSYHNLSQLEDKLPVSSFQRIHKSYIVNLNRIDKYTSEEVEIGGKALPLGKTYKDLLLKRLERKNI